MNSFDAEIIEAYTAVCRGYQLKGPSVLQAFAEALCVMNYLAANDGTAAHSAFTGILGLCPALFACIPFRPSEENAGNHSLARDCQSKPVSPLKRGKGKGLSANL